MDLKGRNIERAYVTTKKKRECIRACRQHQNYEADAQIVSVGLLLELPRHLLFDILSRLPIGTVFSCRCVCKMFLEILEDPYFAELHLSKAPKLDHSLIVQNNYLPCDFSLAYISDLEKPSSFPCWNTDQNSNPHPWRSLTMPTTVSQSKRRFVASLAGSCNGLLCLSYYTKALTIFYVCNPILGEFMCLPQPRANANQIASIGFCPKTKKYKVIRFVTALYCEVHTLGTNNWRRIENALCPDSHASLDSSLYGYISWITLDFDISNMICSFNLETEQLCYIPPPSHINRDTIKGISCVRVGAIGGLFCVFYLLDGAQLEVCVMREYGVEASWTKEFTVNLVFNFLWQPIPIIPMKLLSNGDLLVRYNYCNLVYYSFRKGIFRELMAPGYYHVVSHAPSFVSLKNIAGDQNVEVVRRNESALQIKKRPFGINLSAAAAATSKSPYNEVGFGGVCPFGGIADDNGGVDEIEEWEPWTLGHHQYMARTYHLVQQVYGTDLASLDYHISEQMSRPVDQVSWFRSIHESGLQGMLS